MKALWKLQRHAINNCTNTHNNFKSTDKSGTNSTPSLLSEDITMIYFQDKKCPVIWQVYGNRLLKGCQSWISSILSVSSYQMWHHFILQRWLLIYLNIYQFLHALNFCQLTLKNKVEFLLCSALCASRCSWHIVCCWGLHKMYQNRKLDNKINLLF